MGETKQAAFRLPRLTAAVDCGPIGYPGLEIHFWLNVTYDPDRVPDEDWLKEAKRTAEEAGKKEIPERPIWDRDYFYSFGRIIDRVVVPGEYTADGQDLDLEIGDGRALHELVSTPGFEQNLVNWAAGQYYNLRAERLRAESKN